MIATSLSAAEPAQPIDQLAEQIRAYEWVSFDVFDTALQRPLLDPGDRFLLVGQRAGEALGPLTAEQFQRRRLAAEQRLRLRAVAEGGRAPTLAQIYAELQAGGELTAAQAGALSRLELETEATLVAADPDIRALFQDCLSQGKRVVFVCEHHAPPEAVARMLAAAGYEGYHRLFVAPEGGVGRAEGLFWRLLDELALTPERLIHVGDDERDALKSARAAGIAAAPYSAPLRRARQQRDPLVAQGRGGQLSLFDSAASALAVQQLYAQGTGLRQGEQSFWWQLGFAYIGRIYYGFTSWLIRQAARERVAHLYFLARDGQVLLRALELFRASGAAAPPASYLYVSRRSLTFPALSGSDASLVSFVTDARRLVGGAALSVADYLGRIGIDVTDYPQAIREAGFAGLDDPVRDERDIARLVRLVRLLRWPIQSRVVAERELLRRYLDQERFFERGKIGVVDVGWYGSMQYALVDLSTYLGRPLDIAGFYLGTYGAGKYRHLNMHGYVIDRDQPANRLPLIWEADGFIEFMLSGRHASVINYAERDSRVVPHLGSEPVNDYRMEAAVAMQEGALAFVEAMLARFGPLPSDADAALRPLGRLIFQPSDAEVEAIGDIAHHETLGEGHRTRYFARPRPGLENSLALGEIMADYEQAFWKVGYLRRSRASPLATGLIGAARALNRLQRLLHRRCGSWAGRLRPGRPEL